MLDVRISHLNLACLDCTQFLLFVLLQWKRKPLPAKLLIYVSADYDPSVWFILGQITPLLAILFPNHLFTLDASFMGLHIALSLQWSMANGYLKVCDLDNGMQVNGSHSQLNYMPRPSGTGRHMVGQLTVPVAWWPMWFCRILPYFCETMWLPHRGNSAPSLGNK